MITQFSQGRYTFDRTNGISHISRFQQELTQQRLQKYQNKIFSNQNQVDSSALQEYLNSVRTTKIGKEKIFTQNSQITNIINSVYVILKQLMVIPQNQNSFAKILSVYAQLIKSRQKDRNQHFSIIQDHLKDVLRIDIHRKNKKLYMFISKVFQFNPYRVYKILQSKPQFLQWNSEQSSKIYNLFINYASEKKNQTLILKQIKKCIEKEPQELQRLKILLTYFPQTKNQPLILSIYQYINQLIEKQFRSPKKQLSICLLQTINLFVSIPWPEIQTVKKNQTIIKYLSFDNWKGQNCSKEVRHLLNQILQKLQVKKQTLPWIKSEVLLRIKQLKGLKKDQSQNYRTLKILFSKLKKDNVQMILTSEQVQKIVEDGLKYQLREDFVSLLEQIKNQQIHGLKNQINVMLKTKIEAILKTEKNSIRERSLSCQEQPPIYYTLQDKRLALKALRKYKFESLQVYGILKQHILKSELINKSEQIKGQVIKACLYSLTVKSGKVDKVKIMSSILNLINKDLQLKIMTIEWFRQNQPLYDKKIFQIFKEPEYLNILFQDYASNHMILKRFSIKVLCFIYPLSPCEIVPFLKRVYYHIYDRLSSDNIVGFDQKKQALRLTREILRHRTQIIYDDASTLCNFLYNHLYRVQQYESAQMGEILIELFKTIIDLIKKIPKNVLPFAYPISNYIVKLINSKDSTQKLKTYAIGCFNQLIRNCSYVLVPYFHFKHLFQIIRAIFQQGVRDPALHIEILRLLGNIGFLTKDKYDRVKSLTLDLHQEKQINKIFQKTFKQTNYIRHVKNEKQIGLLQNSGWNGPYLFTKQETLYTYIEISSFKNYILFKINKIMSEHPSKAINFMVFKVLESLTQILSTEQQKFFQQIILNQLLKPEILKQSGQLVFSLMSKIVKSQNIKQNTNLILTYLGQLFEDKKMVKKKELMQLIFILTQQYHKNPYKNDAMVRNVLSKIAYYMSRPETKVQQIKIGLKIIQNLAQCIDNLIHLFLPQFNKNFICQNQQICLCYFQVLLQLCKKTQSTEFYLPPIKQSLIFLLKLQIEKNKTRGQNNSFFIQKIIDFVLCLMLIYGDRLKGFIVQFKKIVDQFSPHHLLFRIAVEYMKNHSTLNYLKDAYQECEIKQLLRKRIDLKIVKQAVIEIQIPKMQKKIVSLIIDEFNCDKNQIQDQSQEWFSKICISLFEKSPELFVHQCLPLVKEDRSFCYDIFPVAFYFFWNDLQDEEKKKLANKLKAILESKVISLSVKQKFLDTIYLMDQWKVPIPLSYKFSKQVCSAGLDSAKALFYLQSLFQKDPEIYGQQLIQMYAGLQQNQSAIGLLKIVQNLNTKTKIKLYQKLKRYHEALKQYDKLEDRLSFQPENMLMQISIRKQMSDWESVHKACNNQANKSPGFKQKLSELAVEACINLGKWDQVANWLDSVPKNHEKVNLWMTMLKIHQKNYKVAEQYISLDRKAVYSKISQLFNFSFERVMQGIIRLQQLCQLQQATIYLKLIQQEFNNENNDKEQPEKKLDWTQRKKKLENVWNDRIQGSKKSLNAMQVLLMTRNLLLTKTQDINNWIDYCHLALRQNQTQIAKKTLKLLEQQLQKGNDVKKKFEIETLLIQTKFILDELKDEEAVAQIQKNIEERGNNKPDQSICRLYYNCAMWLSEKQYDFTVEKGNKCIQMLKKTTQKMKNFIKGWHLMGLMHLKIDQILQQKKKPQRDNSILKQAGKQIRQTHIFQALHCFIKSVSCGVKNHGFFLQDCLKIMNILFNQNQVNGLVEELQKNYTDIPAEGLIDIIPQIIGRLDMVEKPKFLDMMKKLLIHIGQNHPQALVFYLVFLKKCQNKIKQNIASDIVKEISKKQGQSFNALYNDTEIIVKQLCKVSLKLNQKFKISIQKLLYEDKQKDPRTLGRKILRICDRFKREFNKERQKQKQKKQNREHLSISQFGFLQQYLQELSDIVSCLEIYQRTNQFQYFRKAQNILSKMVSSLESNLKAITKITLQQTSPQLMKLTNTAVCIPGSYNPNGNNVFINSFNNQLEVISSKQRPKKLIINASNSKQYLFLLKGKQDLRLDQRIMQLFNLINKMFHDPVERQNYSIKGYSITPISLQTGIIEWVKNCDTIADLIMEYRKATLGPNKKFLERQISARICKDYLYLPKAHKVQIYKEIQSKVSGNDLKKIFWIRSSNSEEWLRNRSCYTRSLAVMSIVGYVIGLGDRHPHNIMIQKNTGKIVHIDFGDCFDVTKIREQFPEKVPFRLTRMLVKNMQPCGIHGIFQHTCQKIIKMLRSNKQSIIAIIESFTYDPIIGLRLNGRNDQEQLQNTYENNQTQESYIEDQKDKDKQGDSKNKIGEKGEKGQQILNQIKKKLGGKSKNQTNKVMSPQQQVSQLIREAMSPQNLVQHFQGWSIYW